MKLPLHKLAAVAFVILLLASIIGVGFFREWGIEKGIALPGWEVKWLSGEEDTGTRPPLANGGWIKVPASGSESKPPENTNAVWIRASLPSVDDNSAALASEVYGSHVRAFVDDRLVYESKDKGHHNGIRILIPLDTSHSGGELYIYSYSEDLDHRLGPQGEIKVGHYEEMQNLYASEDLMDLIIGASLIFMAIVLGLCSVFLKRDLFLSGFLLMLIILSAGVLMVGYSPYLTLVLENEERWIELVFDIALLTLLPAFTYFFEKSFGPGRYRVVSRLRKFQISYSVFCMGISLLRFVLSSRIEGLYQFFTVNVVGVMMILQYLFLLGLAIRFALRRNMEAIIFTGGFAAFALTALIELSLFYMLDGYHLYWWKWGMVGFLMSLIIILGRRFAKNHEQVVEYSRELEKFNNDLQRSEKMEIISELAASVAHEVRNPLQVTRGFLQIMGEGQDAKQKEYLHLAISELDRAVYIINDFLTFAKPEMDKVEQLDVGAELKHVAGILLPLAKTHGGNIEIHLEDGLYVQGSSPKLKQAFINIIKNGIESLPGDGTVSIVAWKPDDAVAVSVRDTGEGMTASELARLGEPYFSNKTKGTGLGLMVTFRIIEAMNGTIEFRSTKGKGTEVTIKLPALKPCPPPPEKKFD